MSRFTPLETVVLAALAWELDDVAPDLAGQFEESLPGSRKNTGAGLFTEMIVDHRRPPSPERATGRFGSVHVMVGDLPDPVAFQVELRDGRLLGLRGDAYGQDTKAIDFRTVPFDCVFTIDERGRSIEFEPKRAMAPDPVLDLRDRVPSIPPSVAPALINVGALQRVQDPPPTLSTLGQPDEGQALAAPIDATDDMTLRIGAFAAIAAASLILWLAFGLSFVFVLILAFVAMRFVSTRKGLAAVRQGIAAWQTARATRTG